MSQSCSRTVVRSSHCTIFREKSAPTVDLYLRSRQNTQVDDRYGQCGHGLERQQGGGAGDRRGAHVSEKTLLTKRLMMDVLPHAALPTTMILYTSSVSASLSDGVAGILLSTAIPSARHVLAGAQGGQRLRAAVGTHREPRRRLWRPAATPACRVC